MADTSTLQLNGKDNVAIALRDLTAGELIQNNTVRLEDNVPSGHKISLVSVKKDSPVMKYGQVIGYANKKIEAGQLVHSHNLGMGKHTQDYDFSSACEPLPKPESQREFMGFHRANGKVGTRNYIGVLTSVNCSASVARFIAEAVEREGFLNDYANIDGIVPIVHGFGCGMSSSGDGFDTLFRTLTGYANNPNFGAILLVGLGCEVMQISTLVSEKGIRPGSCFRQMTIQQTGGTRKSVEQGVALVKELAVEANTYNRTPAPASALVLGMQCGGSDGYSGVTANPALGVASDHIVRHGGTTILSETPEIYGAEYLLTRRAITPQVGQKLIARLEWWEDYCKRNRAEMDNNPSPGNKRGGLTTILEKSLGAVAKAGSAPLSDVVKYAEPLSQSGLIFMDSPGYDPCSVTGQIASGANLIAFTTGRGSVSGFKPTPCIKLASNSDMYERLSDDMDMDCGGIIRGDISIEEQGERLFDSMLAFASGKQTASESLGFGGSEFVPWQIGAVM